MPGPLDPYWYSETGMRSGAGVMVTPETALRVITVYACVRVIAETLASLPNYLKQILGEDDYGNLKRKLAVKHPLFNILLRRPNPWQTPIEFYEMLTGHVALRGNGYAQIVPGILGAVDQLIPKHPARMKVQQLDNGDLRYVYTDIRGKEEVYRQDQILHLRGFTSDGIVGMNPVAVAREGIGLAIATDRFGARAMHNNATPNGMVVHPSTLSDKAYARLRASMRDQTGGIEKAGSFLILEEGMKWQQVGLDMEDLQFLETRKMNKREICTLFRVPPHMVGDLEAGASYSSVEEMGEDFVTYTLRPWFVRWEQAIARDLIDDPETYEACFDADCLLRGKTVERYQAYSSARTAGWMSANEIRGKEGLNPVEGGDEYSNPATTPGQGPGPGADDDGSGEDADPASPSNGKKKPPVPPPGKPGKPPKKDKKKPADEESDEKAAAVTVVPGVGPRAAWLVVLARDAAARLAAAEVRETERHAAKAVEDLARWKEWCGDFFMRHLFFVEKSVLPLCEAAQHEQPSEAAKWIAGEICDMRAKTVAHAADPAAFIDETRAARPTHYERAILNWLGSKI
jgi:HK97 family phage portal protein